MQSRYTRAGIAWILLAILMCTPVSIFAQAQQQQQQPASCTASSCRASCSPPCSSDQVCTLGTMTQCGVCPASSCVSRSVLGLGSSTSSTASSSSSSADDGSNNSSSNGSLIGGLVGGLVGGALVFAVVGCCCLRWRNKKRGMPSTLSFNSQMAQPPMQQRQQQQQQSTRDTVTSGVIPVTYIPPAPTTNDDDDDDLESNRSSVTTLSQQLPATPARTGQAYQVSRARPQIMRVNQVRDSLSRSGSVRTVLTRDDSTPSSSLSRSHTMPSKRPALASVSQPSRSSTLLTPSTDARPRSLPPGGKHLSVHEDDDPFHDRHSIHSIHEHRPSESRTIGDGEITIYWNNNNNA